ncbi:chromosome partitioning protein ParB, partial [Enterobacter sp. CM29]|nr:chromosome partitioning protein ParB [Enterobacter sp. CM29]
LNIWERASSIKTDKDNGADTETLMAIHGLSNKTVVSKYLGVFKLTRAQQKPVQYSYINDLNLISKLAKLNDLDAKELFKRCEGGEQPKKVLTELLNKAKPVVEKEPTIKFSFSRSHCNTILELLGLNPEDLDNPDEDIEVLLKSRLEELSEPKTDKDTLEDNA